MDPAIAIELGSDYAQVGIFQNGSFLLFPDENGTNRMPLCVAFTNNEVLVGSRVVEQPEENPGTTIYDIRQLLGRKFYDPEVQSEIKSLSYDVVERNGRPAVRIIVNGGVELVTPEEILSRLLGQLKVRAEKHLGRTVKDVVLSAPNYFADEQLQSIRDAVVLADMNTLRIINESTAASLAYDVHNWKDEDSQKDEGFFLFYHAGAKCSYLTLKSVEEGIFESLSTARNENLGGEDLEGILVEDNVANLRSTTNIEFAKNPALTQMLKEEVRENEDSPLACISSEVETHSSGQETRGSASENVAAAQSKHSYEGPSMEVEKMVNQVLQESKLQKGDIDGIILTGNPVDVEKILQFFEAHFGAEKILRGIRSDETVIQGLAVQAEILSCGQNFTDVYCLFNVAPLSLGIETIGGTFTKVIPRNTVLPTRKSRIVSTVKDNQSKIVLSIFQGERLMTSRNKSVGTLEITGIQAAPKGISHITVEFEHDDDRTLTVSALDKASGEKFQLVIDLDSTRDEIEECIMDWEAHAEEDSDWKNILETTGEWDENENEFGGVLRETDPGQRPACGHGRDLY